MVVSVALVIQRLGKVPRRRREAIVKVRGELLVLLLAPGRRRVSVVSAALLESSQMLLVVYQCNVISVLQAIDRVMCKALASSRRTPPPHMLYPRLNTHDNLAVARRAQNPIPSTLPDQISPCLTTYTRNRSSTFVTEIARTRTQTSFKSHQHHDFAASDFPNQESEALRFPFKPPLRIPPKTHKPFKNRALRV